METTTTTLFAEVALALPMDMSFHYAVPASLASLVQPGMRVQVPFGTKQSMGYVVSLGQQSPVENVKEILSCIDQKPIISKELFSLARWLSETYMCSLGEALSAIAPAALKAPKRAAKEDAATVPVPQVPSTPKVLTPSQQLVAGRVKEKILTHTFETFLLHGVTSSGKTEVYLSLIAETLKTGRTAIFLLPEISLTPQFITIVQKRFPGLVGVWHSQVSPGERYRTWDAARSGRIKIMLGARSAVFAPFTDVGLIVIDEEHEPTYKQEHKPTYQTREVAIERARINNAVVVLGSATPALESYYRALQREYQLLEMPERIDARVMPPVKVVEARHLTKRSRILSGQLIDALTRVLARREQAIIFLNRRGFAPGIMCHSCGQVWQCPRCAISLVFHREPEGLRCHYCGHSEPWPGICPHCGEKNLAVFGVGTQKVEQELKRLFPQGRIFRLDRDTASKKGVYQQAYEDFKNENCDILIGTQMVAKGFDFPRVTLVGVIDADTALYLPDFHSSERTFQLITQVAGRSGRSDLGGEVILQTKHPGHYALAASQKHDYKAFYKQELEFRRQMNYPPFCRLVNLMVRGRKEEKVAEVAQMIREELAKWKQQHNITMDILGPSQAAHAKLRNLFRWQIVLKGKIEDILAAAKYVKNFPLRGGILLSIDVDPQETL